MTDNEVFEYIESNAEEYTGIVMEVVTKAVKKRVPMKPDYEADGYDKDGELIYDTWICPSCGASFELGIDQYAYCPECGQCIDWSEAADN